MVINCPACDSNQVIPTPHYEKARIHTEYKVMHLCKNIDCRATFTVEVKLHETYSSLPKGEFVEDTR